MPREELLRRLRDHAYFDMDLGRYADPPRPGASLRSTEVVADLLRNAESGELEDDAIGTFLTRLAAAERELGYRGRPMLMDYDSELAAMLHALRRRGDEGDD